MNIVHGGVVDILSAFVCVQERGNLLLIEPPPLKPVH